jgi:quercetin dioxygenase-like cupin family protein
MPAGILTRGNQLTTQPAHARSDESAACYPAAMQRKAIAHFRHLAERKFRNAINMESNIIPVGRNAMALYHATSGEIIDLANPPQDAPEEASTALFRTDDIEVIRRVLQPGQAVPQHEVNGDITLQCLTGSVKLIAHGKTQALPPGHLAYVAACEPYALQADQESVVLMTIVRTRE